MGTLHADGVVPFTNPVRLAYTLFVLHIVAVLQYAHFYTFLITVLHPLASKSIEEQHVPTSNSPLLPISAARARPVYLPTPCRCCNSLNGVDMGTGEVV